MPPGWALAGTGGLTPQPLHPPRLGLVAWFKGDVGLEGSGGLATAWLDQSGKGQDLDVFDPLRQPEIGLDDIDGIPALSFPISPSDVSTYLYRAQDMVNRDGDPITATTRTVMAMFKPKFSAAAFAITGGPVFSFFQQTAPFFECLFDLENTGGNTNGAYAWSSAWRDLGSALQFTPVVGGAGGPFDNVPTLGEWNTTGYPDLSFLVNNIATALTPSVQYGGLGPDPSPGFMMGNIRNAGGGLNFLGSITELLVWDWKLDAAAHDQAVNYMKSRYPSAPIT